MIRYFVPFLAMIASAGLVRANLGDNDDAIDYSYGNVVQRHLLDDGTVTMLYHKDRYLLFVKFDNGRSVLETYCRMDGHDLSEKEIARFLKANAGKKMTWKSAEGAGSKNRKFERSDGKAEAMYLKEEDRPTLKVKATGRLEEPKKSDSGF